MISSEVLMNFLLIGLIAIIFGCLLGFAIVYVVDRRLSNISINMPKIVIPSREDFSPNSPDETYSPEEEDIKNTSPTTSSSPTSPPPPSPASPPPPSPVSPTIYQPTQGIPSPSNPSVGCTNNRDCNLVYGQGLNRCLSNHQCHCVKGTGQLCQLGPTFYKDPKDMTPQQLMWFKGKAKVYKMTLQDYINWLMLFEEDPGQLAPRHLANLQKLLQGRSLTVDEVPRDRIPAPMNAQDYFQQIAQLDDQIIPRNTDTGGLQVPYNVQDYAQFESPRQMKHLNEQNPALGLYKYQHRDAIEQTRPKISHLYDN